MILQLGVRQPTDGKVLSSRNGKQFPHGIVPNARQWVSGGIMVEYRRDIVGVIVHQGPYRGDHDSLAWMDNLRVPNDEHIKTRLYEARA